MAGNDASEKFYAAINEGYDALIDAVRAANDRGHRVSTALIEDAQRGQREAAELAKKWAEAPLDVVGFSGSLIDTTTKAQSRSIEAARQWFGEMAEAQQETRQALQRVLTASRSAGEASVSGARGFFDRTSEAVQAAVQPSEAKASDGRKSSSRSAEIASGDSPAANVN